MSFYVYVIIIMLIVLTISLVGMGVMITKEDTNMKYPPTTNTCPDYWNVDMCGNCIFPGMGKRNSGTYAKDALLANKPPFPILNTYLDPSGQWVFNSTSTQWTAATGMSTICAQQDWAKTSGVLWDGVSNYNSC